MTNPRIAVLQASRQPPSWLVRADELIRRAGFAGITSVWTLSVPLAPPVRPFTKLALTPIEFLERRSHNPSERDALALTAGIPGAEPRSIASLEDLDAALTDCEPDIVLCEADSPLGLLQPVIGARGCRIWVLDECWSDVLPTRYVRSWLDKTGFIETTLEEIAPEGSRRALLWTRSQVGSVSLAQGIHGHFWKVAHLPLRALMGQTSRGASLLCKYSRLTASELLHVAAVQVQRRCRERMLRSGEPQWALAVGRQLDTAVVPPSLRAFTPINPPPDRFWADPFIVHDNGHYYMFFEEMLFETARGRIVVAEVAPEGLVSDPVVVLAMPWHLSYPHVFRFRDTWYMLPESGAEGRVDLYRAEQFPHRWRFERTLLKNIRAYDSTLLFYDNMWWLFSAVTDGHGVSTSDELYIHYTTDLLSGAWISHVANPVVSDVTCARPAGSFFRSGARVFRPAQDSRARYGYGLVIHEVESLTQNEYRERVDRRILPDKEPCGWIGIHTYNSTHGLAVVDFLI